jgi:hypothetical protein
MPIAAPAIVRDLELQLSRSQRFMRLYFSLGGGLLLLGLAAGVETLRGSGALFEGQTTQQLFLFGLGSLGGYLCGSSLLALALPRISAHVRSILVDGLLLPQLFDAPLPELLDPARPVASLASQLPAQKQSIAQRLSWIVNNWSLLISRLGYRPLPPSLARLHILYLALIIAVPLAAILLHSWQLLLLLGSVYILGLALDALECDAVRSVLLEVLRGDE